MTGEKLTVKAKIKTDGEEIFAPDAKIDAIGCAVLCNFANNPAIEIVDTVLSDMGFAYLTDEEVEKMTGGALTKADDYKNADDRFSAIYDYDPDTMKRAKEDRDAYRGKRLAKPADLSVDAAAAAPQVVEFGYALKPLHSAAEAEGKSEDDLYPDYISAPETLSKTYEITFELYDGDKKITKEDLSALYSVYDCLSYKLYDYPHSVEKAAKKYNYAPAQLEYGKITKDENYIKMASDQGYTPAMEKYAKDLLNMPSSSAMSQRVKDAQSYALMEKCAKKGSSYGQYWMGRMCELGRDGTGKPDPEKAFECYMRTTQMKDEKMRGAAYKKLAQFYAKGFGCERDLQKSRECYTKSEGAQTADEFDKSGK